MKHIITTGIIIAVLGMTALALASGDQKQKTTDKASAKVMETPAAAEVAPGPIKVRGVMEKTEEGLALFDGKETYQLSGFGNVEGMDKETLDKMIGKLVSISGDLEKNEAGARIFVKEVTVAN
ncbi:MAG TPA: hypothetical protein DHV36_22075 [Desulfobacteraceae bacterium]|nr:hypothetical protein [Desulfobacteraceae bacterium]|tara:strand:- start:388 stop:756 length:369 start_codon:yes stop_codon:yes gene_type:complete